MARLQVSLPGLMVLIVFIGVFYWAMKDPSFGAAVIIVGLPLSMGVLLLVRTVFLEIDISPTLWARRQKFLQRPASFELLAKERELLGQ